MKRLFSLVLLFVITFSMLPLNASAKTTGEKVGEEIGYEIYSYYWKNGTLYMQGCITNNNKKYDILGMEDAVLVVTDSEGLEMFFVELNDTYEKNCILRSKSKRVYNFSAKNLIYDPDAYSDMDTGLNVFFIEFSFEYGKCKGKNCDNCQGLGLELDENPFVEETPGTGGNDKSVEKNDNKGSGSNSRKRKTCGSCNDSKKCQICKGKGNFYCDSNLCNRGACSSCKGTGFYDHGSYVSKCRTCGGDGLCDICKGTKRRDCTICLGSGKCTHCK